MSLSRHNVGTSRRFTVTTGRPIRSLSRRPKYLRQHFHFYISAPATPRTADVHVCDKGGLILVGPSTSPLRPRHPVRSDTQSDVRSDIRFPPDRCPVVRRVFVISSAFRHPSRRLSAIRLLSAPTKSATFYCPPRGRTLVRPLSRYCTFDGQVPT